MTIFSELYNKVFSFFKNEAKNEDNSKDTACNRLKLVLMQDRAKMEPALMEKMRSEMIDVISKYVEIDKDALDLNLEAEGDSFALMLNIPVLRAKTREEIEELEDEDDDESVDFEEDDTNEENEENNDEESEPTDEDIEEKVDDDDENTKDEQNTEETSSEEISKEETPSDEPKDEEPVETSPEDTTEEVPLEQESKKDSPIKKKHKPQKKEDE